MDPEKDKHQENNDFSYCIPLQKPCPTRIKEPCGWDCAHAYFTPEFFTYEEVATHPPLINYVCSVLAADGAKNPDHPLNTLNPSSS